MLALEQDLQQKMQHLALLQQQNEHLKAKTHTLQLALASSELTMATVQNVQAAASLPAAASALASALPPTTMLALQQQQHTTGIGTSSGGSQQDQQQEQGSAAAIAVPPLSSGTSSSLQPPQQLEEHINQLLHPQLHPSQPPHGSTAAPHSTEAGTDATQQNHSGLYTINTATASLSAAAASFNEARQQYKAIITRLGQLVVAYDSAAAAGECHVMGILCLDRQQFSPNSEQCRCKAAPQLADICGPLCTLPH